MNPTNTAPWSIKSQIRLRVLYGHLSCVELPASWIPGPGIRPAFRTALEYSSGFCSTFWLGAGLPGQVPGPLQSRPSRSPRGGGMRPDSETLYVAPSHTVGKHLPGAGRSYRSTVECDIRMSKLGLPSFCLHVCLHDDDRSDTR
jgi:hypothetical protein